MFVNKINRIENIQYKSYALKRSLEIYPENFVGHNYDLAINRYSEFLKEKIKNPILTKLSMNKVLKEHPPENRDYFERNLAVAKKDENIKKLLAIITKQEESQKYSLDLREKLIEENRIDLVKTTPKLSGLKKLMLRLKIMF